VKIAASVNLEVSSVIANLGQTDILLNANPGRTSLAVPEKNSPRLTQRVPGPIETLRAVLEQQHAQKELVGEEVRNASGHRNAVLRVWLVDVLAEAVVYRVISVLEEVAKAAKRAVDFTSMLLIPSSRSHQGLVHSVKPQINL
jgi:D-ribose pyranose/furanose isomerase RbsD